MSEPIYHHYVSAGYLRGFAKSGKHDVVHCVDLVAKKAFPANVLKVGGEDHFNRLHGHPDPNALERAYADQIEAPALTALKRALTVGSFPSATEREAILLLFSLFAARNPKDRRALETTIEPLNKVLAISALGPDSMNSQETHAALKMNSSKHASLELDLIHVIHRCLLDRKWRFLRSADDSQGFITSDYPVNLIEHPSKVKDDWGLGFAMEDMSVFIPLSSKYALLGDYNAPEAVVQITKSGVAAFNSRIICSATRQIYAYSDQFEFFGPDDQLLTGSNLPDVF
ncbi:DUF4238 domain-containing protein [Pseudomonas shirazensis]|uniref:DUF4238 domain-containing protein n=1 Tax=Pseudomonas shirazensis TaxID=2745494 RepID=UPI003D2C6831